MFIIWQFVASSTVRYSQVDLLTLSVGVGSFKFSVRIPKISNDLAWSILNEKATLRSLPCHINFEEHVCVSYDVLLDGSIHHQLNM